MLPTVFPQIKFFHCRRDNLQIHSALLVRRFQFGVHPFFRTCKQRAGGGWVMCNDKNDTVLACLSILKQQISRWEGKQQVKTHLFARVKACEHEWKNICLQRHVFMQKVPLRFCLLCSVLSFKRYVLMRVCMNIYSWRSKLPPPSLRNVGLSTWDD